MKSKSERESDSEAENVNHYEICPHVLEKIDELANVDSGKNIMFDINKEIYIFLKGGYILKY